MNRRLAAILASDVVGYSRLMESDEVGVLDALQSLRATLIDPIISAYSGRVVKLMGDGSLVEFASVVDAVAAATEIQSRLAKRNSDAADDAKIELRIGVHLGDVIADGDDIYGDGVNIAARLEGLAAPGGVCISQQALDQVETKLPLSYEDRGEQRVKNMARSVRVYDIAINGAAPGDRGKSSGSSKRRTGIRLAYAVSAGALCIAVAVFVLWRPWEQTVQPASIERMAHALPDRPSLAVLPFANLSNDEKQQHFVDGMSEDLITDLSRVSGLFVIARNSSFKYHNQSVSIPLVAEDLGVRYVLEGSVRRDGDKLRVNAQLTDAITGGHVWAERYDGVAGDVFSVQDMFVREIVEALKVSLTPEEEREIALGQTSNLAARDMFQQGWESFLRYTPEDNADAEKRLKEALEIDPEYGRAYAALSLVYLRGCQLRWNEPLGLSVASANSLAKRSLHETEERPSSLANVAAAEVKLYNNQHAEALIDATRAISSDPNDAEAYIAMAWTMITTGNPESGLEFVELASRLNPTSPSYYALPRAIALFAMDDLEAAAAVLSQAVTQDQGARELSPVLAATYAKLGRRSDARAALKKWKPGASQKELGTAYQAYHFPYSWSAPSDIERSIVDGLQLAGLPEELTVSDLADALSSETAEDRVVAARRLSLFGPRAVEAVPALIDALADEDNAVRRYTTIALGRVGPKAKAAIPALTALQSKPLLAAHAEAAILNITGE